MHKNHVFVYDVFLFKLFGKLRAEAACASLTKGGGYGGEDMKRPIIFRVILFPHKVLYASSTSSKNSHLYDRR
jgi:hypothetical protein